MAEPKQDETFKVVDRRLFTAEGELRKDALEQEQREQKKSAQAPAGAEAASAAGANPQPAPASPEGAERAGAEGAVAQAPQPSRGFQLLVDFLARNAAAMMGGYADPQTGQAFLDLDGAREIIDMLDALHEKTDGNLSPEDDRLLLEVLGSLKLSFLEISKAAAQAMHEKAKSRG